MIDPVTWMIISLITTIMILAVFCIIILWLGKEQIINQLKIRFKKGMVHVIILGSDKRVYFDVKQFSGKEKETTTTEINGLPYNMNKKKIRFFRNAPCLLFEEGNSEPLEVDSGSFENTGLTPELFKQAIIVARQSGKLPMDSKKEQLQFYLMLGACIGGCVSAYLTFRMTGTVDGMKPILEAMANSIAQLVAG